MLKHLTIPRWLPLGAILLAVASRFLPHPWNLTPVGAMFLFTGFASARPANFALPFAAYVLSDMALNLLVYHAPFDVGLLLFTWLGLATVWLIGRSLRRFPSLWTLPAASLTGSIAFFAISNFGSWVADGIYPRTPAGLALAYVAGIPFFPATVIGDLLFNAVFFGAAFALSGVLLAQERQPSLR